MVAESAHRLLSKDVSAGLWLLQGMVLPLSWHMALNSQQKRGEMNRRRRGLNYSCLFVQSKCKSVFIWCHIFNPVNMELLLKQMVGSCLHTHQSVRQSVRPFTQTLRHAILQFNTIITILMINMIVTILSLFSPIQDFFFSLHFLATSYFYTMFACQYLLMKLASKFIFYFCQITKRPNRKKGNALKHGWRAEANP